MKQWYAQKPDLFTKQIRKSSGARHQGQYRRTGWRSCYNPWPDRLFRAALDCCDAGGHAVGLTITTGAFAVKAKKEAWGDGAHPIELVDSDGLVKLFENLFELVSGHVKHTILMKRFSTNSGEVENVSCQFIR